MDEKIDAPKLNGEQGEDHEEGFGELLKFTFGGFFGGIVLGVVLDYLGFQKNAIGQWLVRTLSGEGESIFEGIFALRRRLEKASGSMAEAYGWGKLIGMMVPCCAEHDALYADQWRADENGNLVVVVTGAGPRNHWWAPIGREYLIEDYKTIKHSGNPTGHSLLFVSPLTLQAICFVYGDGV